MKISPNKKLTSTIVISLLMTSIALIALSAEAQPTTSNSRLQGSVPLPAGVTANITVDTLGFLSFRPNPVGIGQTVL